MKIQKSILKQSTQSILVFRPSLLIAAFLALFCCLTATSVLAQDVIRIPDRPPIWRPVPRCPRCWPHPPIIEVERIQQDEQAIEIGAYSVDAHVDGMYAHVTTEFTIINKNSRVFEGELEFPLPDGATISGYAIDIDGAMVDAQIVEKEKARIAFEAEVKKGVDPGIVEQVRGNSYRTRVYPIPANGHRKLRVTYIAPLTLNTNGDAALALPMPRTKLTTRDVKITVNIPGISAPELSGLGDDCCKEAKARWVVEDHEKDIAPGDDILVAMPPLPQTFAIIENTDGENFFMASVLVPPQNAAKDPQLPSSYRIIWDASGSRGPEDIKASRAILEALPQKASYELHEFRNVLEPVKKFNSRDNLLTYIDSIDYDGGTDFEPLKKIASQKFNGATLFFSDGLDTYTNSLPPFGATSVALISGAQHDTPTMRHICGGRVLDVSILTPEEVIRQIASPAPVVSEITGTNISDMQGIGLPALGRVTVIGRTKGNSGDITIALSNGQKYKVSLSKASKSSGQTIATAWAASRVEELSPSADDHREELLALGRHFSIVSPVSSMIVFERLSQWLEYDIEPPESLTDIHKQWLAKYKSEAQLKEEERENQEDWVEDLKSRWMDRIEWWDTKKVKLRFKKKKDCHNDWCEIYYVDQYGREYDADDNGKVIYDPEDELVSPYLEKMAAEQRKLDSLDWSSFDASAAAARGGYGLGTTGTGGGGAGLGGFGGGGGFGPGGGGGRGGAIAAAPARAPVMKAKVAMLDGGGAPSRMPIVQGSRASSNGSSFNAPKMLAEEAVADSYFNDSASSESSIVVQEWNPNTPYLTALKDSATIYKDSSSLYNEYIKQRQKYSNSPAFYLDCASLFFEKGKKDLAIRILSNLAELKLDDVAMLRVYAWRLREAGEYDHAILILRKVLKLRSDEAISWRDLALTLTMRAKVTKSAKDVQEAIDCYHNAAFTYRERDDDAWTALIALEELNALIAWSNHTGLSGGSVKIPKMDPVFKKVLDTDLRIVMMWDADSTDIDLHVIEPSGEEVYYDHNRSSHRGLLSHDITNGYGPEEYLIKQAHKGEYRAKTKFFASHTQKLLGPATITTIIYTNWGRSNEKSKINSVRLEKEKEMVDIASISIK